MDASPSLKKDWVLNQEAFDKLLAKLDTDRERAGERYENLRQKLITFFECRGSLSPEDHADETINRVARGIESGKEIYVSNPASYFYGVARNILKEYWEKRERDTTPIDGLTRDKEPSEDPSELKEYESKRQNFEQQLECLERCKKALRPDDGDLIIRFYQGEGSEKLRTRKLLANELGITRNALSNRALRIRDKLEHCVDACMRQSTVA